MKGEDIIFKDGLIVNTKMEVINTVHQYDRHLPGQEEG
jgi:hypothetical protein